MEKQQIQEIVRAIIQLELHHLLHHDHYLLPTVSVMVLEKDLNEQERNRMNYELP